MADAKDPPSLERLPSYSTIDPSRRPNASDVTTAESSSSRDFRTLEIYNTSNGFSVTEDERQMYYIGRYEIRDKPDLIIYGGYDHSGPQLALARFIRFEKNFEIYLGGLKTPDKQDWDVVRCATEGRLFHTDFFRFELPADQHANDSRKRKVHWTKTHDSNLGASRFSIRDYKLMNEADDSLYAAYIEHSLGTPGKLKGRLKFYQPLHEYAELAALMVVMALIERQRRTLRQAGRAVPGTFIR
jgi:hypothetical protein